jgi:histidinol dehydrogenase
MTITGRRELREALQARRARLDEAGATAAEIVGAVKTRGDEALREFTRRFDGVEVASFRVTDDEAREACAQFFVGEWRARIERVAGRIRSFAAREKPAGRLLVEPEGTIERVYTPVRSAGIYVPAGTAPLVSSVLMSVIPAQAAGVKRVAVCTPPGSDGRGNRAVIATAAFLGVDEIYLVGGAQAVAALAWGTESVRRVNLVAGPGNEYVAAAKRLVYGVVGLDCPAGPSEVAVYADASAEPAVVLAELAAQAEHRGGLAVLVTADEHLLRLAAESPLGGYAVTVRGPEETAAVLDEIAPEHLVLIARDAVEVSRMVSDAGAVFIGPHSPVALGDYLAGPSHVLPTGGSAASFAGLSVYTFLRPQARITWNASGLARWADDLGALADLEGLPAHRESVVRRLPG